MIRFVGGTGTSIGKTVFSAILVAKILESGKSVAWFKPVETGVRGTPEDYLTLLRFCDFVKKHRKDAKVKVVEPMLKFPEPLSPHIASERTGKPIDEKTIEKIIKKIFDLEQSFDEVVVEGAGGMLTPLARGKGKNFDVITWADFCAMIKRVEVFLVSGNYLGTITHTISTAESVIARNLPIAGIILNDGASVESESELARYSNPQDFEQIFKQKYLGIMPRFSNYFQMWEFAKNLSIPTL